MILSSFKIMIIFNNTSAEIKTKSADVFIIEDDHNFERTEDHATVILKWTDFTEYIMQDLNILCT